MVEAVDVYSWAHFLDGGWAESIMKVVVEHVVQILELQALSLVQNDLHSFQYVIFMHVKTVEEAVQRDRFCLRPPEKESRIHECQSNGFRM